MNFFLPMLFDITINNWYQCLCLILFCSTKIASLLVDRYFNMDAIPVPVVYSMDSDVEGGNSPEVVSKPKILRSNLFEISNRFGSLIRLRYQQLVMGRRIRGIGWQQKNNKAMK